MNGIFDYSDMLEVAIQEARQGLQEGGIPIGAAIFDPASGVLGRGHNRRVQQGDPSAHGETDAFRNAGRQASYRQLIMVTTLAPCWYCSGLIVQLFVRSSSQCRERLVSRNSEQPRRNLGAGFKFGGTTPCFEEYLADDILGQCRISD